MAYSYQDQNSRRSSDRGNFRGNYYNRSSHRSNPIGYHRGSTPSRALRARALRRRRLAMLRFSLLLIGIALTLSLLLFLAFSRKVNAEDDSSVTYYKYYTPHRVEYGDTLWGYAGEYRCVEEGQSKQSYVAEVMSINHLRDDAIREGQSLILPYYSTEYID